MSTSCSWASVAILLFSISFAIAPLFDCDADWLPRCQSECAPQFVSFVVALLTVVLAVHTAFAAFYESTKRSQAQDPTIQRILRKCRKKLWARTLLLFSFVIALMALGMLLRT